MEMSAGPPFWGTRAYIGIGSNMGDSAASLRAAALRLADLGTIAAASQVYETDPVGYEDQPVFLNAVVALDTTLAPETLLAGLHAIEAEFKRERSIRWGPRTLDLDLIVYDDISLQRPELTLPHPRLFERAFVLVPLAEIAPRRKIGGRSIGAALAGLSTAGIERLPAAD